MTRMKFMNTEIDNLTMAETLDAIDDLIQKNKNAYVVTPNVDHIVQLEAGGELCEVYKNADLILTDGKRSFGFLNGMAHPLKRKYPARICSQNCVSWPQRKAIGCSFLEQQRV